jgi:hypothetical protein
LVTLEPKELREPGGTEDRRVAAELKAEKLFKV